MRCNIKVRPRWSPVPCVRVQIFIVCVLMMVWDPSRRAGVKSRLSGHSSRGERQITPAVSGRVSRRLPPDLPAKTFNHRLPRPRPRLRACDGGPDPGKGTSDPPANQSAAVWRTGRPTSHRASNPAALAHPASTVRGCTCTKMPSGANHRWSNGCISASTSPTSATVNPGPPGLFQEPLHMFNFQLLTCNHLQLPPSTPPPPLQSPVSIGGGGGGAAGGARRRIEGKRLMNNPFDTLLQAKEEEIDWTLMRVIWRGCVHLQPRTCCMRLGGRSPVHMYDPSPTVIQSQREAQGNSRFTWFFFPFNLLLTCPLIIPPLF